MNKTEFHTIDEYIQIFPKQTQEILKKVRQTIQQAVPDATEAISYQIPTFKLNGKNLVHFAAYAKHIGFYPASSGINAFKKEISLYKNSKGAVQFPLDKPIPYDLIEKITKYRLDEELKRK